MSSKYHRELNDTQAMLAEESQRATRLQLELDSKDSEVESLTLRLNMASSDTASVSSGNDPSLDADDPMMGELIYWQDRQETLPGLIIMLCYFKVELTFVNVKLKNVISY